ncbi:hypothetical protein CHUAL_009751 [Chamberlinius hualienensis]
MASPPSVAVEAILLQSTELPTNTPVVKGYDFNEGVNFEKIFDSYKTLGFQATHLGLAINEVKKMLEERDLPVEGSCNIFLSFTSNMMASGIRENIKFLVKHGMVDCIVCTTRAVEYDLMRTLEPTYIGEFFSDLNELRGKEFEACQIGNLLIPSKSYQKLENWITPVLNHFLDETFAQGGCCTPSVVAAHLGREINNEESVCYWAQKNGIPIFCSSLTDGVIGDIIRIHKLKNQRVSIDVFEDAIRLHDIAERSVKAGIMVIGGSAAQHDIHRAMMKRGGADYAVYITTGSNFDGSDSGAELTETISWRKIKDNVTPVKVCGEASLIFPILVTETFARHFFKQQNEKLLTKSENGSFGDSYADLPTVKGYDFSEGIDYDTLFRSYKTTGFQATQLGLAIDEVLRMIKKREEPMSSTSIGSYEEDEFIKVKNNCTIFLGYTSNMISSGIREIIRFLVQNKMVDCIVTTTGGIEEDLIKCLEPSFIGDFCLKGKNLREKGINRIGNLLIPNKNYCTFEDWIIPLFDKLLEEQNAKGISWTPSSIIARLGLEINNENSVYYWAEKNKIPVFCPALTDGSIGDMMFFHSYKNPGLKVDIAEDIKRLNSVAVGAINSGMIILGGSVMKHHICNANLMRNGADFSVFINTGCDFDGSDSGASPDEAVSWGKIKKDAKAVKVFAEASLVFPVLVAETFGKVFPRQSF